MRCVIGLLLVVAHACASAQALPNPILYVTQVPTADDFGNAFSTFGSHFAGPMEAPRGGDLMLRYPDGSTRNLTREAGFGVAGSLQGAGAIAVRDPDVHFSGTRAIFSMVVGGGAAQYEVNPYYWQMYEVTGLAQGATAVVTKVANQPADYNNVNPTYLSDGRILFASDRPRSGERHLYPQHDEYESTATVTGLWALNATTGALQLLQHSPSGSFDPLVDSFGRVLYTRWDHLQTDQQAEADAESEANGETPTYGTFDFASEADGAAHIPRAPEVFPEPRLEVPGSGVSGHRFNFFFPWTVHQDGTEEETLNHVGRHELHRYFPRNFLDDPDLVNVEREFDAVESMMQIAEDPTMPGRYVAIDAPEFATHASGQLFRMVAPPSRNADDIAVDYLTPRSTFGTGAAPDHSGRYRNPIVLSDGRIVAVHTPDVGEDENDGTAANPMPRYRFRLKFVADADADGTYLPGAMLNPQVTRSVTWWSPDALIGYDGPLWELSPVEVRARPVPPVSSIALKTPEQEVFAAAGVSPAAFRAWLRERGLGVLVVRDATRRDVADEQQPYNLRVPGGVASIAPDALQVHDIDRMRFLQADQIRGITFGASEPRPGRRPIARYLHDPAATAANPPQAGSAAGMRAIAPDGSVALFVPAQRALTWETLNTDGEPIVRERYWVTVQPGEIRACDGCHGVNTASQTGAPAATNPPQAFAELLGHWKLVLSMGLFEDDFE
ncbi:hypothetical protein [Chiayiivirga flava]|uniref:Hydrazine synthase alpha subunit middle domain-containing protein n=1 Tax=Chiayiivirga flava TaxID=659595 RepID=A0A7W8FYK3_9GAMM|nr:hypothetical protein [Chiayiivirga flava]MBB5207216.1 hypothetical protein [Chiayiivirga flava]